MVTLIVKLQNNLINQLITVFGSFSSFSLHATFEVVEGRVK